MIHHTEKTIRVNVPAAKIWQVLGDFSSVERFATTIKTSPIVNDISSGLGAKRLCTFNDGSSLIEEITDFQEGKGFKMVLSEFSLPLKSMHSEMGIIEIDANSSELYMSSDFVVKAGPLGWLIGFFIMRPIMKGVFKKLMSGLAYHCVTGKQINEKLPPNEELAKIIIS
ncbi:MAG: SRPBCC family protein [Desulfobacterales bacterium]|nr:SRPBCC family protein [Desulfobacterales bacterium]MCP4160112.1 SRPBCC family protein [Deltaproteobacteria bacterium]